MIHFFAAVLWVMTVQYPSPFKKNSELKGSKQKCSK